MLNFCLNMSILSLPSLILLGKTCITSIEFAYNSQQKYELKAENARWLWRPEQMMSSIATVVISAVVFWESGLHVQWCTALLIWEIWATADTKYSWFFDMVANKAELTTNFNRNFWHFLITQSSFCSGKTLFENNKVSIFIKILKCHFWPLRWA